LSAAKTRPAFGIGIDEAGYGPLLGPLCVGRVRIDGDPAALGRAVLRGGRAFPRIVDSKKLFAGPRAEARLETVALAAIAVARGVRPTRLSELCPEGPEGAADHPWYGGFALALPYAAAPEDVAAAAAELAKGLVREDVRLAVAAADARLEGALNARFRRTQNKGTAHLEHVGDALAAALLGAPDGPGDVVCDRLGGRKDYGGFLRDCFPFRPVEDRGVSAERSAYEVRPAAHPLAVAFLVGGESASPLVALASCLAKYAREALMAAFNAHFGALAPGLRPTAGYWEDGRRFLDDLVAATGDASWRARLSRIL
jgi:ribonuclease HII